MSLMVEFNKHPNASLLIMVLLQKLGGKATITEAELHQLQPPRTWHIEKNLETNTLILVLK